MTTSFSDRSRSAVIQVPGSAPDRSKRSIPCTFNGMEGRRLSVEAAEAVPVSTVLSVEYDDELFLGEVVSCAQNEQSQNPQAQNPQTWNLNIKVEQILTGLQSLMALRARLLTEGIPQPLGLIPIGARN